MWNYVRFRSDNSPMANILSKCSCKENLRLVIYNLSENHVECATVSPQEVEQLALGETARFISEDARNGAHAVLAYDTAKCEVYLIDSTPELPVASCVLLCVVTELLNGCVQPRQSQCGRPEIRREEAVCRPCPCEKEAVMRDERGRFVRKNETVCNERWIEDEPLKNPPMNEDASAVMNRRFRIGRH